MLWWMTWKQGSRQVQRDVVDLASGADLAAEQANWWLEHGGSGKLVKLEPFMLVTQEEIRQARVKTEKKAKGGTPPVGDPG